MGFFPKIAVEFTFKTQVGTNKLKEPVYEYTKRVVKGCMVTPESTTDKSEPAEFWDQTIVTLHLPIGFKDEIKNSNFTPLAGYYKGRIFEVQGDPGALDFSPLAWNRPVRGREIFR